MSLQTILNKGLILGKRYSPEILLGLGITSTIAGTVFAGKSTIKAIEVLKDAEVVLEQIEQTKDTVDVEKYNELDYRKDRITVFTRTGVELAKVYAPTLICTSIGVTSMLCSFGILKRRNLALVGALNSVTLSFKKYRSAIVERFGKEVDRDVRNGTIYTKSEVINGKTGEVEEIVSINEKALNAYTPIFDERSTNWSNTPGYNRYFLEAQQRYANDLLKSRGHVFINEVCDMLDIPRTSIGQEAGWLRDGDGDGYIDFGLSPDRNERVNAFCNDDEKSIILDLNVDGYILNRI